MINKWCEAVRKVYLRKGLRLPESSWEFPNFVELFEGIFKEETRVVAKSSEFQNVCHQTLKKIWRYSASLLSKCVTAQKRLEETSQEGQKS